MKKEWKANFEGNEIKFVNEWSFFDGTSIEKVFINDKLMEKRGNFFGITSKFDFDYNGNKIEIFCGPSWYFGTACKILVNGKFIGGNRIVLFCK